MTGAAWRCEPARYSPNHNAHAIGSHARTLQILLSPPFLCETCLVTVLAPCKQTMLQHGDAVTNIAVFTSKQCFAGDVADAQDVMTTRQNTAEAAVMAALKGQLTYLRACHAHPSPM